MGWRAVAFVVNGAADSAMGERARALALRLAGRFEIGILYREGRKGYAAWRFLKALRSMRPSACCVFDLAADGVVAAALQGIVSRTPYVLDTGDDIVALGKALGRGSAGMLATRGLSSFALRTASQILVRGSAHQELLSRQGMRTTFVPDGVEVDRFVPSNSAGVSQPGAGAPLTVGVVGSSVWSPVRRSCYGLELVQVLHILRGRIPCPIRGVLIGDGSGVPVLRAMCRDLNLDDCIDFVGRVAYHELPKRIAKMHICLSTQTNDEVGRVRTTGKLPIYLAAGRFVLASRVGEAARILPEEMLVDYWGKEDSQYAVRLAERIQLLLTRGTNLSFREDSVALARTHFDYDHLAPRVGQALVSVLQAKRR
jgi:glycosyltransferase involved in cell wall biosynthesis